MRQTNSKWRGFSLAELLTVIVIVGLFMSVVVAVLVPVIHASGSGQAKAETVQTAAQGFYTVLRDLRQSTISGINSCTDASPSVCTQPGTLPAPPATSPACNSPNNVPVLAMMTADSGGQRQADATSGEPLWQGVLAYWTCDGTLYRGTANLPAPGSINVPSPGTYNTLVGNALANGKPVVSGIDWLGTAYSVSTTTTAEGTVLLQMRTSAARGGSSNFTIFTSDVTPRNSCSADRVQGVACT